MWHPNKRIAHGYLVLAALSLALPACAQTSANQSAATATQVPAATSKTNMAYGDCSLIDFKDIDSTQLTKAELVQKMDVDFADNLNKSEKCMADAVNSGTERLSAAGAGAGNQAAAGQGEAQGANEATQPTENQAQQGSQEPVSSSSRPTPKGQGQQGSSAVCDTVKQGLAGATTESEKTHFQALMKQYGC